MRVTGIRTQCFRQPMVPIHQKRFAGEQEIVLTVVECDSGHEGYAMARAHGGQPGRGIADAIHCTIKPRVIGLDPLDHERAWNAMMALEPAGYVPVFAISAVDVALWDLAGKIRGEPLYRMLGARRNRIQAYASCAAMDTIDDYVRDLERARSRGYRAYKIHPFDVPDRDIELCRALRKAAGDDYVLMLDVAKTYDYAGSLKVGRVLEELGFAWFEEPLPQYDMAGYARLCGELDIPVIGAETVAGSCHSIENYLNANALDQVLCDVYWKAGVTGMLKTAQLCESRGVPVASHHGASPLMNFANLHVLCGATDTEMIEVLVPEEGYNFAMKTYLAPDRDGFITAPDGAGLGVEIDWDYVRANAVG